MNNKLNYKNNPNTNNSETKKKEEQPKIKLPKTIKV